MELTGTHLQFSTEYMDRRAVIIHSLEENSVLKGLYREDYVIMLCDLYFGNTLDLISSLPGTERRKCESSS